MLILKSGQKQITEGIELPNQKRIRTLGEKETYKYLVILDADTIKQAEIKEKILEKATFEKWENFWKPKSAAEFSLKEETTGRSLLCDSRDHS